MPVDPFNRNSPGSKPVFFDQEFGVWLPTTGSTVLCPFSRQLRKKDELKRANDGYIATPTTTTTTTTTTTVAMNLQQALALALTNDF